jgi:hypothetical protein
MRRARAGRRMKMKSGRICTAALVAGIGNT